MSASCPTCVREGGPYRCCRHCADDPAAHEDGQRDHHDLPCSICVLACDHEAQIRDLLEEREELLTEIRRLRMGNHPAGRAALEVERDALAAAVDRIRRRHPRGDEESGLLAPGLWCPTCGHERSDNGYGGCPDRRALTIPGQPLRGPLALAEALTERDAEHEGGAS